MGWGAGMAAVTGGLAGGSAVEVKPTAVAVLSESVILLMKRDNFAEPSACDVQSSKTNIKGAVGLCMPVQDEMAGDPPAFTCSNRYVSESPAVDLLEQAALFNGNDSNRHRDLVFTGHISQSISYPDDTDQPLHNNFNRF